MVKIIAVITLYSNGRKSPIKTGYRPTFSFVEGMDTSGKIELADKDELRPNEKCEVQVTFVNDQFLGHDFGVGKHFIFREGQIAIGEGVVQKILWGAPST